MSRFSGFPAHIEKHVGRVRGADSRTAGGRERAYHLVYCDHSDGAHVTVLTSGLRERTAGAPLPQELVCTLRAEQELHARHLTGVIAELLTESNSRVGYGALIMNDRVLLPDSEIAGALAAPHPYLGDEFDVLLDADGQPVLQLITLVPITRGEAQLVARYGRDALYDRWEQTGADLLDIHRPCTAS
ncbi:Suppressor of fused protein (SUFU) [Saccharopolyspora antimicrobica]|uniref:Suppressor of fused protein (SUFU) n=1 Tax=Saccharopolyspora antimicrobica TaxID=455193 RepID=A0A1I5IYC1_9PSEU|nr:suppressor of fused domain protein [Saccharopolyspora antimicrobica]RKT83790.1 suppressor of fused protein SUFU [Saccharopolyspora antimicrobica]SFO65565.1 Suppressor of fused protein (SUFU) [Saccharopolyspora antimicrobica]